MLGVESAKRPFVNVEAFKAGNAAVKHEANHAATFKGRRPFGDGKATFNYFYEG